MQHPSILASIARHDPYAAAGIAASSRGGRAAARDLAAKAAAGALRAGKAWGDRASAYKQLLGQALRVLKAGTRRTALALGASTRFRPTEGPSHVLFEKETRDKHGGLWVVTVVWGRLEASLLEPLTVVYRGPRTSDMFSWTVEMWPGGVHYDGPVPASVRRYTDARRF